MNTTVSQSEVATRARENDLQVEPNAVLSALEDPDCRRILAIVASTAATAPELIEQCDLPSSTAYRKLELLNDADLLEERTRIRADGNHVSEYVCDVSAITFEFSDDGVNITIDVGDGDLNSDDAESGAEPTLPRC